MENIFYKTEHCVFVPTDIKVNFREVWKFGAAKIGDQLWIQLISTDIVGPVFTKEELLMIDAKPISKVSLQLDLRAKTARILLKRKREK